MPAVAVLLLSRSRWWKGRGEVELVVVVVVARDAAANTQKATVWLALMTERQEDTQLHVAVRHERNNPLLIAWWWRNAASKRVLANRRPSCWRCVVCCVVVGEKGKEGGMHRHCNVAVVVVAVTQSHIVETQRRKTID